jgi:hypothetical protein
MAQALATFASDADLRAAKIRMGAALPDDGWLAEYMRAVTPLTDAPPEFHLVAGLCALSTAVGNRLYTESWGQNVFPHLWAVLVAPSSFWRKSTAINQAERMLRAASEGSVYPTDFSREKLITMLSKQPAGLLAVKEFGGFLAMLSRDYMAGAKETLTELYDGPDVYTRALQKEMVKVERPALTLLGATTLDWLEGKITEGDLQGGFLARFLFVTARTKASPKGMTAPMDSAARARLTSDLHTAFEWPEHEVRFEPDARDMLDAWTLGWEEEVGKTSHRSDLSGFAVRLQTYALKFSILYRVSACVGRDDRDPSVVDELAVSQAIAYCRLLWTNVTGLIDDKIAITSDAKQLRRILGIIGSGTTRSDALRLAKIKARDFDQYLATLVGSGEVHMVKARRSELGIEGARDTMVQWLAPGPEPSANGHHEPSGSLGFPAVPDLGVPSNSLAVTGEPQGSDNSRELEGPGSNVDPLVVSSSPVHLSPHDSRNRVGGGTRARNGNAKPRPSPPADDEPEVLL